MSLEKLLNLKYSWYLNLFEYSTESIEFNYGSYFNLFYIGAEMFNDDQQYGINIWGQWSFHPLFSSMIPMVEEF